MEVTLLRMLSHLRRTHVLQLSYNNGLNVSPHQSYCHSAGNIFHAGNPFPHRQVLPRWQVFPRGNPHLSGNPQIRPPGLRNPPSTVPTGFPLAIPKRMTTRLPRMGGYPQSRGGLSLLPWIFRRHQHLPLGCQLR